VSITRTSVEPLAPSLERSLAGVVGARHLITDPDRLLVYESDGLTQYRHRPAAVVLPGDAGEVARVVRILHDAGRPYVPRGAGTGLSGGALALENGVVIGTARMNRILHLDPANRRAVVEPGVVNASLTRATLPHGLIYAPDPSSQSACTLGGNVAENSGGPHCLKYGVTSRYVTALQVVLPDGEVVELNDEDRGWAGPDRVGLFVGSEGCFGIVTRIEVALVPVAGGVRTLLGIFDTLEAAGHAVTAIMDRGLVPAALEIVDQETIRAVEASIFRAGYPTSAGAALVVELDGVEEGLDREVALVEEACRASGAGEVRIAHSDEERTALWAGRKKAFGAMGRIAPDLLVQDATVPRSRLPEVLAKIGEIGRRHRLRVANVFHAGDGNLHPNLLFDRNDPDELARVEAASQEIMDVCIAAGGTITGEHGVGLDKRKHMERVLSPEVLHAMAGVRRVLDPEGLCNPGKVLPDRLPELPPLSTGTLPPLDGPAAPASTAEAAEWMAGAREAGVPVRIGGGARRSTASENGSGDATGPTDPGPRPRELPERHLHLVTHRLVGIVEHSPADLTVILRAGTTLGELQAALRPSGQWFPLDPPGGEETTLGEAMAAAHTGPLRTGYGRLRDHLLGATLVTGEGRVLELGGRVVKNVAGFDLLRFAVGSRGAMGLVTRLTLRLFPRPIVDRTLFWEPSVGRTLAATGAPVAALEWHAGGPEPAHTPEGVTAARLHGSEASVAAMARTLEAAGGTPLATLEGAASEEWWEARARAEGRGALRLRVPTVPDRALAVTGAATPWVREGGSASLHLVDGGLRLALDPRDSESGDRARALLPGLHDTGGVERIDGMNPGPLLHHFDPAGILAGRWREGWL
jgi:glycolate oxidase subunit GlcD